MRKKRMLSLFSALISLGLLYSLPSGGQIYQYTDKNGNAVFTDSPPVGSKAKETGTKEDGIYWSAPRQEPAGREHATSPSGPTTDKKKTVDYGSVTVEMYMTSWCGYCKQAGAYVRSLGANLVQYDIEAQPERKKEMKEKSGGSLAVPVIDIGGTIIRGYNPAAIKAAVERVAAR